MLKNSLVCFQEDGRVRLVLCAIFAPSSSDASVPDEFLGSGAGGFGILFHDLIMHEATLDASLGRSFWVRGEAPGAVFAFGYGECRFI